MNANLSSLSLSYPHTTHTLSSLLPLVVKLNAKFIRFQKKYILKTNPQREKVFEERSMGSNCLMGVRFLSAVVKMFWKQTVAMAAQHLHALKLTRKACTLCYARVPIFFFLRNVFIYGKFAIFNNSIHWDESKPSVVLETLKKKENLKEKKRHSVHHTH